MTTKHTPGPWHDKDGIIRTADNAMLALVYSNGVGSVTANARLIAAAPDLLAALRGCVDALNSHVRSEFEGVWLESDFESLLSPYRAAIAKAEGGAA